MSQQRTILLSHLRATHSVCVLGTKCLLDIYGSFPPGADSFTVQGSPGVHVCIVYNPEKIQAGPNTALWPLNRGAEVTVTTVVPSEHINDNKVKVVYYGGNGKVLLGSARLYLTSIALSLHVDTSRDGTVDIKNTSKASWTWGPYGHGAILLVNCDRDDADSQGTDNVDMEISSYADLKDMSCLSLKSQGPKTFFKTNKVLLHVSPSYSEKLRVFHRTATDIDYKHVLGSDTLFYEVEYDGEEEHTFYVEGLSFPDAGFSGLVYIGVTLLEVTEKGIPESPVFTEKVVFRMAPWIMTPNTLPPQEVFVCSLPENADFLEQISELAKSANCKLTVCSEVDSRKDRWIQDEMEFGYTEAPHKYFPVVFDSPRNRGLKDFPFTKILGPDFGYSTREPINEFDVTAMDSFGNLEVSPPVTVRGKAYPLGRILIGSVVLTNTGRRMTQVVRDFLYAQQVQAPVELYSDWLIVGHVDEFMTFVPAQNQKGFRLLLSSPTACYRLFQEKQKQGHGGAILLQGRDTHQKTIDDVLSDEKRRAESHYVQSCINWNRNILKKELGLTEQDIIDIPALFLMEHKKARAFFPNMVNMLVLGKRLGIPKPFGPIIDGKCCLEENVRSLLEPLGLHCTFIDDYVSYHQYDGNVHCGTNVRRVPFSFKWWNMDLHSHGIRGILSSL
ncbi:protein-arginine deiminase type-1-like isoform X2 [Ambystoma mexicanum]|uniref:protein-arginine deiminase type-1-like isoform X2 n=1 Tax=Ambystoma mexicanum TaxID=8296 RepID=UPI0037E75675